MFVGWVIRCFIIKRISWDEFMPELMETVAVSIVSSGNKEKCIFCHKNHKEKREEELNPHEYKRKDDQLTANGRAYIKADSQRSRYYPKNDDGNFVSPLEEPEWSEDVIFKTYKTKSGKMRPYQSKYQLPPIKGWIAAPHHMNAICCMNGTNGLPGVPNVNPWAHQGGYDVNNGGNCIFLPSSASQFFVAYYYWKVRKTGQALQGHLGAHRKIYFETVWDRLEKIVRYLAKMKWCMDTSTDDKKNELVEKVMFRIDKLQTWLFFKISALKPDKAFKLGAKSYIQIPDESEEFGVPEGVIDRLQPYETLPEWY